MIANDMISRRKVLIENITSLLFLQGINYLLPLLTLPYLARTLGIERFGLVSFALAFIQYFVTFVDYGFNLTATRQISVYRDDPQKVSEIFCSVMAIKMSLFIICFLLMNGVVFSVAKFRTNWIIYYVCFIAVMGNVLFPIWFFQGLEHLKKVAIINAVAKVSITALLFIFVKQQRDYLIAAFLQCFSVVVAGTIALIYAPAIYPLRFITPRLHSLKLSLAEGWPVFLSVISSNVFGNINIFLLGILFSNREVGYFSIAQKVIWAFCYLVPPIGNAIYPRMGLLFKESDERAMKFLRKILFVGSCAFISVTVALFFSSGVIVKFITGKPDRNIVTLIQIMAILPLCFFIDNILGTQIMLNRNMDKKYMITFVMGGFVSVLLAFLFIPRFSYIGAAISQLLSEICIICTMIYFVHKANIKVFRIADPISGIIHDIHT